MGEVIVVTSGKGGVGKTTTSANVGAALAMRGKKVVLVDTDIGLRNLDVVMGLENRIVYDIVDVVEGKCKLRQALIKDKRYTDLFLLPAAQTRDKSAVNESQMRELTSKLKEEFDFIRIIGLLEASEIKNPELIINRLRPEMVKKGEMMDVEDILDLLSIDLIGVVPEDEHIITQTNKGEPAVSNKKAPSGRAYIEIARRILGENVEVTIPGRNKGGLFSRIFKKDK